MKMAHRLHTNATFNFQVMIVTTMLLLRLLLLLSLCRTIVINTYLILLHNQCACYFCRFFFYFFFFWFERRSNAPENQIYSCIWWQWCFTLENHIQKLKSIACRPLSLSLSLTSSVPILCSLAYTSVFAAAAVFHGCIPLIDDIVHWIANAFSNGGNKNRNENKTRKRRKKFSQQLWSWKSGRCVHAEISFMYLKFKRTTLFIAH